MSQTEVERFLGRLITDADFRNNATSSLEDTTFTEGITLSKEELSILGRTDFTRFCQVAETLDDAIRRSELTRVSGK